MDIGNTTLLTKENAESLEIEIQKSMGEEYSTHFCPNNLDKTTYLVALWTDTGKRDQLVCTFQDSRSWYLFQQAARIMVKNEQDTLMEKKVQEMADAYPERPEFEDFPDPDMVLHVNSGETMEMKANFDAMWATDIDIAAW